MVERLLHFFKRIYLGVKTRAVIRANSKKGIMAVDIRSEHGFGAKIMWCLEILLYCEENNLSPDFRFTYSKKDVKNDFFNPFFAVFEKRNYPQNYNFAVIGDIHELNLPKDYNKLMTVDIANHLIKKYLIIREEIIEEVNTFCLSNFSQATVLGVHYRGTDKHLESPVVSYDKVKRNIELYLKNHSYTNCIFVSSDDDNFITFIKKVGLGIKIIIRNDSFRSSDDVAIHYSNTNKYDINRDAIVNCLILSRCDALMKCSSILSGISKLFNPVLPIVMLNKPYKSWFPDGTLVNHAIQQAID